ncbi:MAG: hypothetical protein QOK29_3710, partial [Rhodospirillaceae bacterium]|nr:hypothetical protein [Rhodospirillaceae bacterium]
MSRRVRLGSSKEGKINFREENMASFTIRDGQIETTAQIVRYNDTGSIESGGRLEASVIWEGGSANPG